MEEKILAKSECYNFKKLKRRLMIFGVVCTIALAIYGYLRGVDDYNRIGQWDNELFNIYPSASAYALGYVLDGIMYGCYLIVLLFFVWLILRTWLAKTEMIITDKRVYGKAAFGKRVDLPLDSISAVGSGWPKGLTVASASGKINFAPVKNRDELHKCISDLLIDRQKKANPVVEIKQEATFSNADELKKYKELLDSGVITQEEFDTKKKQLLGL